MYIEISNKTALPKWWARAFTCFGRKTVGDATVHFWKPNEGYSLWHHDTPVACEVVKGAKSVFFVEQDGVLYVSSTLENLYEKGN